MVVGLICPRYWGCFQSLSYWSWHLLWYGSNWPTEDCPDSPYLTLPPSLGCCCCQRVPLLCFLPPRFQSVNVQWNAWCWVKECVCASESVKASPLWNLEKQYVHGGTDSSVCYCHHYLHPREDKSQACYCCCC